ncbi:MAG: aspartyl protease family protein, partial [Pyrinomonadaceae bacterium]
MHRSIFLVITVVVAASGVLSQTPNISDPAVALFKQGRFAEAERLVDPLLKKHKSDFDSILLKGRIALFSNKLSDAEKWLTKAKELRPDSKETLAALAEVYYRRNELAKAGALLRQAGRDSIAKKLESFADQKAYEIEAKRDVTEVKFVQTDPLPLIKVKINDGEEVFFLIDTGGGEVIVDSEFATKNNITSFGTEQGTFGGGRQSAVQQGRIDSISLGDFRVKNLPVNILDTKRFAAVAGGRRVDGIIGTILLSRFLSTLDYPGAKLVLRKNTEANSKTLAKNKSV